MTPYQYKRRLTRYEVVTLMGFGFTLTVEYENTPQERIYIDAVGQGEITVSREVFRELIPSITRLTEHGEGQRLGWRQVGLQPKPCMVTKSENIKTWYVFIQ